MSAMAFRDFRGFLQPGSGFQSLQFRLIENRFGQQQENRIQYNRQNYRGAFYEPQHQAQLQQSEAKKSLSSIVNTWLERTPGLESDGFNFTRKYAQHVHMMLSDMQSAAEATTNEEERKVKLAELQKTETSYSTVLEREIHDELRKKGDRRFSHKAMMGALLIFQYRDEPRFNQPYQILNLLMDIDR